MSNRISRIFSFASSHKKTSLALIVAVCAISGYIWYSNTRPTSYTTIATERRDITLEVYVTGSVKPAQDAKLAFDASGRVGSVYINVGDKVYGGQTLATLEGAQTDIYARYLRAQANLDAEEAKLAEMKQGARPEELAVSEAKAEKARAAILYAQTDVSDAILDGYIKTDDAIRNKADQLFSNPRTSQASLNIPTNDAQAKINAENTRIALEGKLVMWQINPSGISGAEAHEIMRTTTTFLDTLSSIVNALLTNSSLSQTTIDTYKAAVLTARTNTQTADSALSSAEQAYSDATLASKLADADLALVKAGSAPEAIVAQEARVSAAKADLAAAQADLAKASIRSPFSGVVTKIDVERGESVAMGAAVITVIGDKAFEVEARIPETDIANIAVGKTAVAFLDAYGKAEEFKATVFEVEPAETVVEGVPTYIIRLSLEDPKKMARSGMTADLTISADKKEQVLAVPSRAIKTEGTEKTVLVLNSSGDTESRVVRVGLRGSDGYSEIIEGLSEGELVVTGEAK